MPKFKPYNQHQAQLLPPTLAECLPHDHFAFLVNEAVDGLDLAELERTYGASGAPAYDPRLMVKVLFYGYSQGIASSRKIEMALYENNAFRYLAGNRQPDHGTISLFRKSRLEGLKSLFAQLVLLCGRLDLADLSDISIDGTKIRADASKKNFYTQDRIDELKKKIGQDLADAIAGDEAEDEELGEKRSADQLPPHLADKESRKKAIEEARKQLDRLKEAEQAIRDKQGKCANQEERSLKKNNSVNLTDPDANLMKMKDGSYQLAYNVQLATADQVITDYEVTNEPADGSQFTGLVKGTEETTGQPVESAKADAAYFSKDTLEFCEEEGIDAYIPDPMKAKEEKEERDGTVPKYDRRNFCYDQDNDYFICPEGKPLVFKNVDGDRGRKYAGTECSACPAKTKCTKGQRRHLLFDQALDGMRRKMRDKLNTEDGKAKYLERLPEAEAPFGNLKRNLNFTRFHLRGKPMVLVETGLYSIAHNLVKIFNHLKKEKEKGNIIRLNPLMRSRAGA
jgi:transposase